MPHLFRKQKQIVKFVKGVTGFSEMRKNGFEVVYCHCVGNCVPTRGMGRCQGCDCNWSNKECQCIRCRGLAPSADLNMDLAHRVAREAANLAWSKVPSLICAAAANEKKSRQDKAEYAKVCQARHAAIHGPQRSGLTFAQLVEAIERVERECRMAEAEKRRKTRELIRVVAEAAATAAEMRKIRRALHGRVFEEAAQAARLQLHRLEHSAMKITATRASTQGFVSCLALAAIVALFAVALASLATAGTIVHLG